MLQTPTLPPRCEGPVNSTVNRFEHLRRLEHRKPLGLSKSCSRILVVLIDLHPRCGFLSDYFFGLRVSRLNSSRLRVLIGTGGGVGG